LLPTIKQVQQNTVLDVKMVFGKSSLTCCLRMPFTISSDPEVWLWQWQWQQQMNQIVEWF